MADKEIQEEVEKNIEKDKKEVEERKVTIDQDTGKVQVHRPKQDNKHKGNEEDVKYTCPKCGREYSSESWFEKHLKNEHDLELEEVKEGEGKEEPKEEEEKPEREPEKKLEKERIDPGVPGLKEITSGGFLNDSTNLVTGGPGSGKSTLAMQMAISNIEKNDIPVVYITFEEPKDDLLRDLSQFDDWKLQEKIDSDKLSILSLKPEQVKKLVSSGGGIIQEEIKKAEAGILIVDSVNMFVELYKDRLEKREALLKFFHRIERWDITTFLIAEKEITPQQHSTRFIDFEVDSITLLYNIKKGNIRQRAVEIFKMRGTSHSHRIYPFKIQDNGIKIYPQESVF